MSGGRINFYPIFLAFCALFFASPAVAKDIERASYAQYVDYCLGTGGKRETCDCTYNTARKEMAAEEIGKIAYSLRARVPTDPRKLSRINEITSACISAAAEKAAAIEAAPILPGQPPVPLLNVPPPAPPSTEQKERPAEAGDQKPDSIDYTESNFLSQIKNKKEMPSPPINPIEDDGNNNPPKKSSKKSANPEPETKRYYGQYDNLYFSATASGDMEAIYAISPYLDNVDLQNENGDTPLMVAIQYGKDEVIKFLLSQQPDVNIANGKKQTALHMASFIHRPDIVQQLLDNGADMNLAYKGGFTPLMVAITAQDPATIKILANPVSAAAKLDNGDTALHLAALTDNPNIIAQIAATGANLEAKNNWGETPLLEAAKTNKAKSVYKLLTLGANLTAVDNKGQTAYQIAYSSGGQDSVNAILTFLQTGRR